METGTAMPPPARPPGPQIRWGGILAGSAVSGATYLLIALFGFAAGLTVVGQQPPRSAPIALIPGVWTGFALTLAGLLGGYVAARLSGLPRRSDGILHGLVTWATVTLLLTWIASTAARPVLGGSLGLLRRGFLFHYPAAMPVAVESVPPGYAVAVTGASWWLFGMLAFSLLAALVGGALGARSVSRRAVEDHDAERHLRSD